MVVPVAFDITRLATRVTPLAFELLDFFGASRSVAQAQRRFRQFPRADVATACSCETPVPSRDLPKFDAAFVGTALSHRIEGSNAFWTFDVEQAVPVSSGAKEAAAGRGGLSSSA